MANIDEIQKKSTADIVSDYLDNLTKLMDDHNTTTSKTRDNLLNCIESNKRSITNSSRRCKKTIQEFDEQVKSLSPFYTTENEKIQEKNDARIASNNKTLEEYTVEHKNNIIEINKQYDQVVNEENDKLDNLQYLNRKELQQYLQGIDVEEYAQNKELENTIQSINREIDNLQKKLSEDVESLKHKYMIKSSEFNENMRKTRNEFIEKEKDLRMIARDETSSHHKQIEELNKSISITQKNIIN